MIALKSILVVIAALLVGILWAILDKKSLKWALCEISLLICVMVSGTVIIWILTANPPLKKFLGLLLLVAAVIHFGVWVFAMPYRFWCKRMKINKDNFIQAHPLAILIPSVLLLMFFLFPKLWK